MRLPSLSTVLLSLWVSLTGLAQLIPVPNHSFETNTTDGGTTYQVLYEGFNGLPGWRWSTSPAPVLIGNPPDNPGYAYATPFGQWQVDLSGSENTTGGWIETTLTGLTPGATYALSFALGTSVDWLAGGGAPSVAVSLTGQPAASFSHLPTATIHWTVFTHEFIGPEAGQGSLRFMNTSPAGTGYVAVDQLELTEVIVDPAPLQILRQGDSVTLVFFGQLQQSPDLKAWTTVADAVSPWTVTPAPGGKFFRSLVP